MNILAIGIATLDIVNLVDGFPAEDSEVRAFDQQIRRGGNATNTLVMLSQLGHRCSWGGVLVDDPDCRYIVADLERYHIDRRYCRLVAGGRMPTSYITVNRYNGSRTIVHYRDLPEFSFADFCRIDLQHFDWVHFEGRNVTQTARMLKRCAAEWPQIPCSLEVEKSRSGIEELFPLADLLLFSKDYAKEQGFESAAGLLKAIHKKATHALLTCTWGAEGAWSMGRDGTLHTSPAYPPDRVLDTTGAGDVFNAAIIDGLGRGKDPDSALQAACRLAGRKCGQMGLELSGA